MTIIASDSYDSGLSSAQALTGRTLDNALGGSGTRVYVAFTPGGVSLLGNGAGGVNGINAQAASLVDIPLAKTARVRRDPLSSTSNMAVYGCRAIAASGEGIAALLVGGNSLRFATFNSAGTRTDRATLTIPNLPVPAGCFIEVDWKDPSALTARILNSDGSVRNATAPWNATVNGYALPASTHVGYGFSQGGNVGNFDDFIVEDGPTYAAPILASTGTPTATSTTTATAPFTTDINNGLIYYVSSSGSPDETAIMAGASQAVTAVGAQSLSITGLTAGSTGNKIHAIHRRAEGVNSAIVRTATFSTPSPIAPPGGSAATTIAGDKVTLTYTPTGTVSAATASLPVGTIPNGAVAQGPVPMVFAAGVWTAEFTAVAPGSYAAPVVLASNVDNPSVSITGAQAFTIIPLNGSDVPDGSEIPDVPVAFSGTVPAQAATVGVPLTLNLASYFTGTRVPFVGSVFAGSLAGSGLALSGLVISGTPTSAATLAGLVVRATDADGATANTNAFTITIAAAADTTVPVMTGALTVSLVAQTSYTLTWLAASDNVGVTGYEVSTNGGTSWVDAGNVLTYGVTGRTAGTTDQVRVRAYDAAGNRATGVLSTAVTLLAVPDTTLPVMTGAIAITARTHNSYTSSVPAATDNVAVTGYRVSQDGGSTWIDKTAARTHDHTGRTPGATDQVRWSARDAAGNWANALAAAVTLDAAPVEPTPGPLVRMSRNAYFDLLMRCGS